MITQTLKTLNWKNLVDNPFKDVRDRSGIMVCEIKFGAKILPVYSPLNIKVK